MGDPIDSNERPEIAGFTILQELGEGGMGTVYLAEQRQPVHRRVALKVVKLGMDSKEVVARFEAERQALALMNHDHIARVYEAGTTARGQPYFVMEHVPGVPLIEYCDQNRVSVRERLDLFVQICEGVQHAHDKGVVHRDLKPGNVLVSAHQGKAVPKIIDFGVARATDRRLVEQTLFTEFGQIVGTPEYMSPEQAGLSRLEIDARSDVYSLGVLLYELLVGALPFPARELRQAGLLEIQRRIREDEPPRPSTRLRSLPESELRAQQRRTSLGDLARRLRGDLDWIVMRALEKDRNRRYPSARAFADDIGRHLHDEPVSAGPPSALYRLRKAARRHRRALGTLAAVAVVGTAIAGWFHLRERDLATERDALREEARALAAKLVAATQQQETQRAAWDAQCSSLTTETAELAAQLGRAEAVSAAEAARLQGQLERSRADLRRFEPLDPAAARASRLAAVRRATVRIETEMTVRQRGTGKVLHLDADGIENFDDRGTAMVRRTAGSGLVLSPDGRIATAGHLVSLREYAQRRDDRLGIETRILVTFAGEADPRRARVLSTHVTATSDLALIELRPSERAPVASVGELAFDQALPSPGDDVFLMGYPAGGAPHNGDAHVFAGTLSRVIAPGLLQIDAVVQPGGLGGPLTNAEGQVIGINLATQRLPDGSGAPALSYAVPIAELAAIWPPRGGK